ncbi:MAG: TlpA disulfide reductase family protein [Pyrinomonadaceae bacterium]
MMRSRRGAALLFLTLALILINSATAWAQKSEATAVRLTLKGVDGRTYDSAKMQGRVLVVSFGATWCKPCLAEIEALEELKREYKDRLVTIWWVSIENEAEKSDVLLREYAKDLNMTIPVLRDRERTAYQQFSQRTRLPLVVFYRKDGTDDAPIHVGMSTPEIYKARMRERIDPLLKR